MIARAVCAPRICLSCRLGLAKRRAFLDSRNSLSSTRILQWRFASDNSNRQSKERVEALISGANLNDPTLGKKKQQRGRIVLPEWGLSSENDATTSSNISGSDTKAQQAQKQSDRQRRGQQQCSPQYRNRQDQEAELLSWELASNEKSTESLDNNKSSARRVATQGPLQPAIDVSDYLSAENINDGAWEWDTAANEDEAGPPNEIVDSEDSRVNGILLEPEDKPKRNEGATPSGSPKRARVTPSLGHDLVHHEHLSVEALGRPVDAIVINNPNTLSKGSRTPLVLPEEKEISSSELDWKSLLPDTDTEVASEEVTTNIEELRPVDSNITRHDFDRRRDALVEGFTRNQLALYFSQAKKMGQAFTELAPSYSWMTSYSPWTALNPEDIRNMSPKQQLARLILTASWGVKVQEDFEGLGLVQLGIPATLFPLVAHPSGVVMKTLKSDLLDDFTDETVVPEPNESKLNIYVRHPTVSALLSKLDELIQSIETRSITLDDRVNKKLSKESLKEVARVTKTYLKHNRTRAELEVLWITADGKGQLSSTDTEDAADVVLRLLRKRPTQEVAGDQQIIVRAKKGQNPVRNGTFVPHHREKRSMSWQDKLVPWSRFAISIKKPLDPGAKGLRLSGKINLPRSNLSIPEPNAYSQLSATFGHVLHSNPELGVETTSRVRRRILSPVVPHPASFTNITADGDGSMEKHTAIILNFAPAPPESNELGANLPEVRLRLPVDVDNDFTEFAMPSDSSLYAILPQRQKDVLLPTESVDVRLLRQCLVPLDVSQPSLLSFFNASEFNLLEGRLRTPSRTRFSIPTQLTGNKLLSSEGSTEAIDAPYMFAGLEIHQTVDLGWNGFTLRYSSIEAGQHGGQRQELSLESRTLVSLGEKPENRDEQFLELVKEIAAGKHFSWAEGPELMQQIHDEGSEFERESDMDTPEEYFSELEVVEGEPLATSLETMSEGEELLLRGEAMSGETQSVVRHSTSLDVPGGSDQDGASSGSSDVLHRPEPSANPLQPAETVGPVDQHVTGRLQKEALVGNDADSLDQAKFEDLGIHEKAAELLHDSEQLLVDVHKTLRVTVEPDLDTETRP